MDPQCRMLLEKTYEAIVDAGEFVHVVLLVICDVQTGPNYLMTRFTICALHIVLWGW
jgi:hypothetical protein